MNSFFVVGKFEARGGLDRGECGEVACDPSNKLNT